MIDIIALTETAAVLILYSGFLIATFRKVGFKRFGVQEHCTIWVFFIIQFIDLINFIFLILFPSNSTFQIVGHVIDAIIGAAVIIILLYYCYQMKVVQLKLESEDVNTYLREFRKAKVIFTTLTITAVISMGIEIPWSIVIEQNNYS